jgi:phenylpropionate dioxygenase-like ring-hydroxylating dioxygenase large terminal subunit
MEASGDDRGEGQTAVGTTNAVTGGSETTKELKGMSEEALGVAYDEDRKRHNVPGPTYQYLLDKDRYPVPAILRERSDWPQDLPRSIPRDRAFSQEIHDREVEGLWLKVWQMVCRVDQVASVGDSILYKVAGREYIVVRVGEDEVKAFPNTCLHRGRRLRNCDGPLARLRCPFHGFTWKLDGELVSIPTSWDFADVDAENFRLPEARVEVWGGFVFMNLDPNCGPLSEHLGDMPRHFERVPLDGWSTKVHAVKEIACNWKIGIEAFIEAAHVFSTHPQTVSGTDPCNSQYDIWDNFVRIITPMGVPSVLLGKEPSEQRKMDGMMGRKSSKQSVVTVPDGELARHVFADLHRGRLRRAGIETEFSDAELVDLQTYWIFPNILILGGPRGTVIRFRPVQSDPERCVMDVMSLRPGPPDRKLEPAAPTAWLNEDQAWSEQPGLSDYELVDQDMSNMTGCQSGLRNLPDQPVQLSGYQEAAISHFHHLLYGKWLKDDK